MKIGRLYRQDGACVMSRVWQADTAWQRMRGLLGRPKLRLGEGLLLAPCAAVHTFGMHYALDLVFLDRDGVLCEAVEYLPPWHVCRCTGAYQTLELAPGSLARLGLRRGEALIWREWPCGDYGD